jgi:hypothetical protein
MSLRLIRSISLIKRVLSGRQFNLLYSARLVQTSYVIAYGITLASYFKSSTGVMEVYLWRPKQFQTVRSGRSDGSSPIQWNFARSLTSAASK